MPFLVDIETSFPENYYSQQELIEKIKLAWKDKVKNLGRVENIHSNVLVKGRHLALPVEEYFSIKSFDEKNSQFITSAVGLGQQAITKLLSKNQLKAEEISSLWSNTVTGFSIPSLEARIMNLIPFSRKTKRVPLLGLGCMAGVAGINRVADYLKSYPDEAVIFFSVELCSLTFQMSDFSVANFISTGLFGDGAAAVLMVGDKHQLAKKAPLKWLASESVFFNNTEQVMGWQVGEQGMKIILGKGVPEVTEKELPGPLVEFLKSQGLNKIDIADFFAHPGGPKVLLAIEKVLALGQGELKHSWESLAENGNMSSVSVLDIFKRQLDSKKHKSKNKALSLAMGPGFSAEIGLFEWV
jgi:alkylresorcinol/alkylpyrone synthase